MGGGGGGGDGDGVRTTSPSSRLAFPRKTKSSGQCGTLDDEIDRRAFLISSCSDSMLGSYRPRSRFPSTFTRDLDISTLSESPTEQNAQSEVPNTSSASTSSSLSPFSSEMDVIDNRVKMETVSESETNMPPTYFTDFKSQLSSFNLNINIKSKKPFSSDKGSKNNIIRSTHSSDDISLNRKKTSNIYRMFGSERKSQADYGDGKQKTGDDKGQQEVMSVLTRGDFIGYKEMQYMIKHPSSLTAIDACHYYTLDHSDVLTLMRHNPMVAFEFQRALGLAVDEMDNRMRAAQTQQLRGEFFSEIKDQFKKRKASAIQSRGLAKVLLEYAAKKQKEKDDAKARAEMSAFDREFFERPDDRFCRNESFDNDDDGSVSDNKFSVAGSPIKGRAKSTGKSRRGGTITEARLGKEKEKEKECESESEKASWKIWTSIPFLSRASKISTDENEIPGISSQKMAALETGSVGSVGSGFGSAHGSAPGSLTYKTPNATMSLNKKVAKLNRLHAGLCDMDRSEGYRTDFDFPLRSPGGSGGGGGGGGGGGFVVENSSKSIASDDSSRWKIGYIRKSFVSLTSMTKEVLTPEVSQKEIQPPVVEKSTYYQTLRDRLGRRLSHRRGSISDSHSDPSALATNIDSISQTHNPSHSHTHSQEDDENSNRNRISRSRSHGRTDGTYSSLKSHRSTADILNRSYDKAVTHHRDEIVLHMEDHIPGLRRATSNPNL